MKKVRSVINVSALPGEVYGSDNLTWWGAMGGEVIEGFVLVLAIFAYFYLRANSPDWPPLHTPLPSLGIPTINLVLMLASIVPAALAYRAAKAEDRTACLIWLSIHFLIGAAICVVRYYECFALNVRWDSNAYGSINWALLFAHGYTMLLDVFDTAALVILCIFLEPEEKHYVDITENSFFWYFVVATWIPVYFLVFLGPRF
jgi:heme/copper-type cytochrome/quinol oxidase subunit 3